MNEKTTLTDELSSAKAITVQQSGLAGGMDAIWPDLPGLPASSQGSSQNMAIYLHGLRRHWVKATALGLLLAFIVAPLVWFWLLPAKYEASAYLHVNPTKTRLVRGFSAQGSERLVVTAFDIYKNTQLQYLQSSKVLIAALGDDEVLKLRLDEREEYPIIWLQENLTIGFPGQGDFLEVGLTCYNPKEARTVANAVVRAYMKVAVDGERKHGMERLDELQRVFAKKHADLTAKRNNLKMYAEQLGSSDVANITLSQRMLMEDLASTRRQLMQVQLEQRLVNAELGGQKALRNNAATADITEWELTEYLARNPQARELEMAVAERTLALADARRLTAAGGGSRHWESFAFSLEAAQRELDAHKDSLRESVREMKCSKIDAQIQTFQAKFEVLGVQEKELQAEVLKKSDEVRLLSGSPVEIEMMRAEIEYLDKNLSSIGQERDQLGVELGSVPRITLYQPALLPETEANRPLRIAMVLMIMAIAFCIPGAGIIAWDARLQRINSSEDVSKDLGLTVIGSVPLIPARILRALDSPSKQNQNWQLRLTESVDAVAARLLRQAAMEQQRVVLITSAVGGEGKTTLATQLALSLARSGRNTVLVDFDLRRPSLGDVFALPAEPGVSEILRRQADLSQSIHQTGTDNLSMLTAGRWDRNALAALANGAAEPIFEELRSEYEFVIVDSSPILPVADTRFVSQYVDAVILSVFRDVSRSPKVRDACEILEAFGVTAIEAVVTGSSEKLEARDMQYESQPQASE